PPPPGVDVLGTAVPTTSPPSRVRPVVVEPFPLVVSDPGRASAVREPVPRGVAVPVRPPPAPRSVRPPPPLRVWPPDADEPESELPPDELGVAGAEATGGGAGAGAGAAGTAADPVLS